MTTISPPDPAFTEDFNSLLTIRKQKYGSLWKQQRLHAFHQTFDVIHVLVLFVSLGVICLLLAGLCYYYAVTYPATITVDYSNCSFSKKTDNSFGNKRSDPSSSINNDSMRECFGKIADKHVSLLNKSKHIFCTCQINVTIPDELLEFNGKKLALHYELTGFHQNVRRYKREVDWDQLGGHAIGADGKPKEYSSCKSKYYRTGYNNKPIFPCGNMANSYFSDTFKVYDSSGEEVNLDLTGIAWPSDIRRFKNPSGKHWRELFDLPRDWHDSLKSEFFDNKHKGVENENFIVWMRAAALNKFRKRYAYIGPVHNAGEFTVEIQYRFEVQSYNGKKELVIAADSHDRPVNYFFFYAYLTTGVICLLIGPLIYVANRILKTFHNTSSSTTKTRQNNPDSPPNDANSVNLDRPVEVSSTSNSRSEMEDPPTTKQSTRYSSTASVKV